MGYSCHYCNKKMDCIIEFCNHYNAHNPAYFQISLDILKYVKENKLEPNQELLEAELVDDVDILHYIVGDINHEMMSLEVLNMMNENKVYNVIETDNKERLMEYLRQIGEIDEKEDDINKVAKKYDYDKWEDLCHYTNDSLLTLCIEKKWNKFCLRLLDFSLLHRVKKQNITNAYELSIKNKLPEVTEKITKINQIGSKDEEDN